MKKLIKWSLGVAMAASLATPVMAADMNTGMFVPDVPDPVAEAYSWSGGYVGASVGYQGVITDSTAGFVQPDGAAAFGTLFAGYNAQFDHIVLGFEGDIGYSGFNASAPCANPAYDCNVELDWMGSARGRVGFAADSVLFYLTGGLAVARFSGDTDNGTVFADSSTRLGYTVGAGIEAGLNDHLTARLEYRYTDYGDRDMTYDIVYPDVGVRSHTVALGLAYKF